MKLNQRIGALEVNSAQAIGRSVAAITARTEELRAADEAKEIVWPKLDEETHRMIEELRRVF